MYANSGIILCASIKAYGVKGVTTIRADKYKSWKTNKLNQEEFVKDMMKALEDFDIYVAHNGQYFDKPWINSVNLRYGLKPTLRFEKFVDPVALSRRHLRLARNSLSSLLDYFDIPESKTPIRFAYWMEASHNGSRRAMDYIVQHCEQDVLCLEQVYDKVRKLVKGIDDQGSSR